MKYGRKEVLEELETIQSRIWTLGHNRELYLGLRKEVDGRKELWSPPDILDWVFQNHGMSMAIGLRTLFDKGKGTVSLVRIFKKLSDGTVRVTRDEFVSMYSQNDATWRHIANSDFDHLCGKPGLVEYPSEQALRFMSFGEKRWHRLAVWVDKRLAHWDKNLPEDAPRARWIDLERTFRVASLMYRHLELLWRAANVYTTGSDLISHNWASPLKTRWAR